MISLVKSITFWTNSNLTRQHWKWKEKVSDTAIIFTRKKKNTCIRKKWMKTKIYINYHSENKSTQHREISFSNPTCWDACGRDPPHLSENSRCTFAKFTNQNLHKHIDSRLVIQTKDAQSTPSRAKITQGNCWTRFWEMLI